MPSTEVQNDDGGAHPRFLRAPHPYAMAGAVLAGGQLKTLSCPVSIEHALLLPVFVRSVGTAFQKIIVMSLCYEVHSKEK